MESIKTISLAFIDTLVEGLRRLISTSWTEDPPSIRGGKGKF